MVGQRLSIESAERREQSCYPARFLLAVSLPRYTLRIAEGGNTHIRVRLLREANFAGGGFSRRGPTDPRLTNSGRKTAERRRVGKASANENANI